VGGLEMLGVYGETWSLLLFDVCLREREREREGGIDLMKATDESWSLSLELYIEIFFFFFGGGEHELFFFFFNISVR
jgi:hypothetical protein